MIFTRFAFQIFTFEFCHTSGEGQLFDISLGQMKSYLLSRCFKTRWLLACHADTYQGEGWRCASTFSIPWKDVVLHCFAMLCCMLRSSLIWTAFAQFSISSLIFFWISLLAGLIPVTMCLYWKIPQGVWKTKSFRAS